MENSLSPYGKTQKEDGRCYHGSEPVETPAKWTPSKRSPPLKLNPSQARGTEPLRTM